MGKQGMGLGVSAWWLVSAPTCQRATQQLPSVFIYKKWAGLLEPFNVP